MEEISSNMAYSAPKTSMVITLGGCLLVSSLFFYFIYMPNRRVLDQNLSQIRELEQKIQVQTIAVKKLREKIASFNTRRTHLNYFNRLHLEESDRVPYLLKSLTKEANALGIKFLSVDPQQPENKNSYRKYIFKVEVRATYPQMLRFLNCIENKLKLNIDRFNLSQTEPLERLQEVQDSQSESYKQVTAKIYLNTLEMEDDKLKDFDSLAQVRDFYLNPNSAAGTSPQFEEEEQESLIAQATETDPFHPQEYILASLAPSLFSSSSSGSAGRRRIEEKPPVLVKKDDQELVLKAIIDFEKERRAILGQDVVKSGDILENTQIGNRLVNMKVLSIGENTVTLGDGQERYTLKLSPNPVQFK